MNDTIEAEGYIVVEPTWRGKTLTGATITGVRKTPPRTGAVGSAVIRLRVAVPRRVFLPFQAEALVEAQEGEVGVARVVIEPFSEEET